MLLLTSASSIIRATTGSAADVEVHASCMDHLSGTVTPVVPPNQSITTATTTTVVTAPAASTQRNIKYLSFFNNHASQSCLLTVEHYDGTTYTVLTKYTLLAGESCELLDTGEWKYYDATGAIKPATTKLDVWLRVTADSVHATAATLAAITGLSQAVISGRKYAFEAHLFHISNATTTGAQFAVGGVAMTLLVVGSISTVTNSVTAAAFSAGSATAVDTIIAAQTTGSANVAPTIVSGYFQPSADGTFSVKATSEVTVGSGLTVKAGSWLHIRETDN